MATFNKYEEFVEDLANAGHNFGSDTFKYALTNTAPNAATHTQLSDINEIAAGNGYTAGGTAVAITSATQSSGILSVVPTANVVFTASGGAIAQFRYVVFYNDTSTNDDLISYFDYGSAVDLADGESLTVTVGATLLTIT